MKTVTYLLAIVVALNITLGSINADAATKKKKAKPKQKQTTQNVLPAIAIGYPSTTVAYNTVKARNDVTPKSNLRPFGWQERSGPWYVANENDNKKATVEWAFTEGGHYAHPSVIKRYIDVGSKDHVYVDMAFRCGAATAECDQLLTEFKDVALLIRKVYQKKYIQTADGTPAWTGVDSLE